MSLQDDALILHGLDDAIAGESDCGRLIYDYNRMLRIFIRQGMSQDEAIEWIDYNVMGVQCNGKGFIVLYDHDSIDISGATETSLLTSN
tara:strand:+ start:316 stop:582 length:267 start_codon:yes stop_codon:yes gene_type:complete